MSKASTIRTIFACQVQCCGDAVWPMAPNAPRQHRAIRCRHLRPADAPGELARPQASLTKRCRPRTDTSGARSPGRPGTGAGAPASGRRRTSYFSRIPMLLSPRLVSRRSPAAGAKCAPKAISMSPTSPRPLVRQINRARRGLSVVKPGSSAWPKCVGRGPLLPRNAPPGAGVQEAGREGLALGAGFWVLGSVLRAAVALVAWCGWFNVAPAGARNARTSEGDKYRGMLRRKFPWLGLKRKKRSSKWKTRTDEISPQQSDKYINPPPDPRPRVVQALELVGQQIHCADLEKDGRKDVKAREHHHGRKKERTVKEDYTPISARV